MSAPKKNWVNSMFSEFSNVETKRKKCEDSNAATSRVVKSDNVQATEKVVHFEAEQQGEETLNQKFNNNWIDFFAPRCSEQLALHPKKRQELQLWLRNCTDMNLKRYPQLCLLTGPSGSGKTAAVRILAKEFNISIQEWINPIDQTNVYNLGDQTHEYVASQLDTFKQFLFKASRYRSLLETSAANKCLLMIEDFPNFLIKDPTAFQDILEDYVNYAKSPLIFIVTDAKNRGLNISFNVFTEEIKHKFHINHISFNSVASTIMLKSMKRFCTLMQSTYTQLYKVPPQDIVDSIIISAQGDIRNALLNLHFSSLRGAPKLLTKRVENVESSKAPRKKKLENKLKSLGRDESLTVMHALGRVFNPKFKEDKRFIYSPEELSDAFRTEPKKFIDLVQSNYILHFREIEYVLEAADGLSLCDIMLNEYRDDSLALAGLNIGIRSVMVSNTNPVTGWMPIKGQNRLNLNAPSIPSKALKVLPDSHNIPSSLYALDYKTFVNIILT